MDEKLLLTQLNKLNTSFKAQVEKREAAPAVTATAAVAHAGSLAAPVPTGALDNFFKAWDTYYPKIVSLLGWASWLLPASTVNIIKALLAVVNNNIIPLLKDILQKKV